MAGTDWFLGLLYISLLAVVVYVSVYYPLVQEIHLLILLIAATALLITYKYIERKK